MIAPKIRKIYPTSKSRSLLWIYEENNLILEESLKVRGTLMSI
jgi:hypothetical protein